MLKVLLLGDINSAHLIKWAQGLSGAGIKTGIYSLSLPVSEWYKNDPNIQVFGAGMVEKQSFNKSSFLKIGYLKKLGELKQVIRSFNPDIVHAHYATSYGLLAALSAKKPVFISIWGSDLIDFPHKSFLHKLLLGYSLKKATRLFVTSKFLQEQLDGLYRLDSVLIPFGVNVDDFSPVRKENKGELTVGTVKSLQPLYQIDKAIKAFAIVSGQMERPVKMLIVGDGPERKKLEQLVSELQLQGKVEFSGNVEHSKIPLYHNQIDVLLNLSVYESFGVSVLEAAACGTVAIVNNVGGLKEVVVDGITGYLVDANNEQAIVSKLEHLLKNDTERNRLALNATEFVRTNYDWKQCLNKMLHEYKSVIKK